MTIKNFGSIFWDIRFWILVLFAIRLENWDLPPLDNNSMRETLTLAAARNFLEISPDILRPCIDFGGTKIRILGAEFPLFSAIIAVLYKIFGEHEGIGRMVNLVFSSFGLWFFYAFLKKLWQNERAAMMSTVFFAVSLAFIYARKSMPDTFSLSWVFAGNFFGQNYLKTGRRRDLGWFALLSAVGFLCKIPSLCLSTLLLAPLLDVDYLNKRKIRLILFGILAILPAFLWIFGWIPYLVKNENAFPLFEMFSLKAGWKSFFDLRNAFWEHFFNDGLLKTWAALAMTLVGIWYLGKNDDKKTTYSLLAFTLLFTLFAVRSGWVTAFHDYYQIPFIVPMAMLAGYGLQHLLGRWPILAWIYLVSASANAIYLQKDDFFAYPPGKKYIGLEKLADSFSTRADRFICNYGVDSGPFYYLHRKGMGMSNADVVGHPEWIQDAYQNGGMKFVFIDKTLLADSLQYPVAFDNAFFRIYRLEYKPDASKNGPNLQNGH
jgi:hypothetical protein